MPAQRRVLTPESTAELAAADFVSQTGEELVGLEREWPVYPTSAPWERPSYDVLAHIAQQPLPRRGKVTIEPGGQIELSTATASSLDTALLDTARDSAALHERLRAHGLQAAAWAVDTHRTPERILLAPRYAAMEDFFTAGGEAGKWMMNNTAGLQVNVSHDPATPERRWRMLHELGPVLVAMFANSPGLDARGRRWESLRQGIWWALAPQRTRPVGNHPSPARAWADYALNADVMVIRDQDRFLPVEPGFSFHRWITQGHPAGWPTAEDFAYHLTTLFPPIRPRGWLELRMLDALPANLQEVAAATICAGLTTEAVDELEQRLPQTAGLWAAAARDGLRHPLLAVASQVFLEVATRNLRTVTDRSDLVKEVSHFADRYTNRQLSPAQLLETSELRTRLQPNLARPAQTRSTRPLAIAAQGGRVWRCWR